jgi:hypothetical protein
MGLFALIFFSQSALSGSSYAHRPSNQYDTKQNHRIYRHMLRLVCGFIVECGYDSSWNNY